MTPRRLSRSALCLLVIAVGLLGGRAVRAEAPPEPEGYRQEPYQAPTPATLQGAAVVTTIQAKVLWRSRAARFVDVLPHAPKPAGLPAGTIWRDKPHDSIPGAAWLPDVGRASLAPETEDYFRRNLSELTMGNRDEPLVIFCKRNCWMSWNAAKRAVGYGYRRISWFPDGIDGWAGAALPTTPVEPRP